MKILKLFILVRNIIKKEYYGFVDLHIDLNNDHLLKMKSLLRSPNNDVVKEYESLFASLIGSGESISYASARMGFYSLMKVYGIKEGDEIILPAATCSVMVNAVLRIGAKPVYSDIDSDTFGSSIEGVERVLTKHTKMIVAQHSFGIPCDIQPIVKIANKRNIIVIEDCALSLESKRDGIKVGNFGDASIFSTDRSKPLNTITGGMVYSKNRVIMKELRKMSDNLDELPKEKQKALFSYIIYVAKYGNILNSMRITFFLSFLSKLHPKFNAFLDDDFSSIVLNSTYSYPSKLPSFLAYLGILEINKWSKILHYRKIFLSDFIKSTDNTGKVINLPVSYFDNSLEIIPHRIVWSQKEGKVQRESLSNFINISWTWFLKPIISTKESLSNFYYVKGSCPRSEKIGANMVNVPIPNDINTEIYINKIMCRIKGQK
jgi:perosamine synthetase